MENISYATQKLWRIFVRHMLQICKKKKKDLHSSLHICEFNNIKKSWRKLSYQKWCKMNEFWQISSYCKYTLKLLFLRSFKMRETLKASQCLSIYFSFKTNWIPSQRSNKAWSDRCCPAGAAEEGGLKWSVYCRFTFPKTFTKCVHAYWE